MPLTSSELILNPDQSIYHLNLHPEDLADTVITVGDPDRVSRVSRHFDTIELRKEKREFRTHTGSYHGKRISVISTGIGTDNVDIVLNELDALVNINLNTRRPHLEKRCLTLVRVGTSGGLQPHIPVDSFLLSDYALGLDGLLHYYRQPAPEHQALIEAFVKHTQWSPLKATPYLTQAHPDLATLPGMQQLYRGITATNPGFYGPQGRRLRLKAEDAGFLDNIAGFSFRGMKITNMEMETSALYGLAALMGHKAVSINCILANRATGEFSANPETAIDALIEFTLKQLTAA